MSQRSVGVLHGPLLPYGAHGAYQRGQRSLRFLGIRILLVLLRLGDAQHRPFLPLGVVANAPEGLYEARGQPSHGLLYDHDLPADESLPDVRVG